MNYRLKIQYISVNIHIIINKNLDKIKFLIAKYINSNLISLKIFNKSIIYHNLKFIFLLLNKYFLV